MALRYADHIVIPDQVNSIKNIGGLSGITYNPHIGLFIACADKPPARILEFSFKGDSLELKNLEEVQLKPGVIIQSELESIIYDEVHKIYYLSDEQSAGTRIFKVKEGNRFESIILPLNLPLLPLSGHNSGIEGLALTKDKSTLFFAFERPTSSCFDQQITTIGRINLFDNSVELFGYQLHDVAGDRLNTNGISEIIYLNDSSLLVMERAYLPGTGNVVRLFEVRLGTPISNTTKALECTESIQPLASTLVYDFASVDQFKIDNAEGMCFNKDRSKLFIITDNNFSKRQQTQIISLDVVWHQ